MLRVSRRALLVACSAVPSSSGFHLPGACATLGAALRGAEEAFDQQGVPEARISAEHLLSRVIAMGFERPAFRSGVRLQ